MEAARTLIDLPERMRRRRFGAACEELRPLGIAYALRHFGRSLDRADAEDIVAEVIIRFDRLDSAGRPPERLRPAFFTSVRNAALDLLRYRAVRPAAPLEAAASKSLEAPGPEERAEAGESVVRLREAMARMRPNYREAIVLRFGLGLTVPEIAGRMGISLPAAKKLVLRSTAQIRDRMEGIEGRRFCPEMREIARRSVIDGEIAGVSGDAEAAAIRAHLEHCGPCRTFLGALRADLHELGAGALLAGLASGRIGLATRLLLGLHTVAHAVRTGAERVRLASYRASGALSPEGGGPAGLLAGTGQKIAAVCTAGVAGAAGCVATGIVGPGLGVASHQVRPPPTRPAAIVGKAPEPARRPLITYPAPSGEVEGSPAGGAGVVPQPRGAATTKPKRATPPAPSHHAEAKPRTPAQSEQSEFGFEAESSSSAEAASTAAAAPVAQSQSVEAATPTSGSAEAGAGSSQSSSGGSGGQEEFGFGG